MTAETLPGGYGSVVVVDADSAGCAGWRACSPRMPR